MARPPFGGAARRARGQPGAARWLVAAVALRAARCDKAMGSQAPSVELAANQGCMIRGARASITSSTTDVTVPSTNVWLGVANSSEEADTAGCWRRTMKGSQMGTDLICPKAALCATQYSITFVGPLALPGVSVSWSFEGAVNMSYHWTLAQRDNSDMQFRFRFERCESSSVCEAGNDSEAAWLTMDSGVDKYASWSETSFLNITDLPFSKCQENQVRSALAFAHNVDASQVAISDLSQTDVKSHANATDLGVKYTVLNFAQLPQFLQIGSDSKETAVFVNSTVQASIKNAVQMGDAFVKAEGARVQQEMLQYQKNPSELMKKFHAVFPKSLRLKNAPGTKLNFSATSQDMRQSGPVYEALYNKAATVDVKVPNSLNFSSFSPLLQVCGSAQVITANSTWSERLVSTHGQQALKGAWSAFMGVPNTSVMIEKISQEPLPVDARRLAANSAVQPTVIHFVTGAADSADAQRMRSLLVLYSKEPSLSDFLDAVDQNSMDNKSYRAIQLVLTYAKPLEDSAFVRTVVPAFYSMPELESAGAARTQPATLGSSGGGGSGFPTWLLVCLPLLLVACCALAAGALLMMRRRDSSRGNKTRSVGGDFPKGEYKELDMETCQALPNGHHEAWDPAYADRPPEPRHGQGQMHTGEAPPGGRPPLWRCTPQNVASVGIRAMPDIEAAMTKYCMQPGEVFEVSEERLGPAGVTFLRLADGRGWLFDRKPGVGTMCTQEGQGARELQHKQLPEAGDFEVGQPNTKAASRLRELMPPPAHLQLPGPVIPGLTGSSPGRQAFDRSFSSVVTGAVPLLVSAAAVPPGMCRPPGSVAGSHAMSTAALVR